MRTLFWVAFCSFQRFVGEKEGGLVGDLPLVFGLVPLWGLEAGEGGGGAGSLTPSEMRATMGDTST